MCNLARPGQGRHLGRVTWHVQAATRGTGTLAHPDHGRRLGQAPCSPRLWTPTWMCSLTCPSFLTQILHPAQILRFSTQKNNEQGFGARPGVSPRTPLPGPHKPRFWYRFKSLHFPINKNSELKVLGQGLGSHPGPPSRDPKIHYARVA